MLSCDKAILMGDRQLWYYLVSEILRCDACILFRAIHALVHLNLPKFSLGRMKSNSFSSKGTTSSIDNVLSPKHVRLGFRFML